jgi:hypothetical protein
MRVKITQKYCQTTFANPQLAIQYVYDFSRLFDLQTPARRSSEFLLVLGDFIHSFSILSDDRSKASSKTIPPHSAI